MSTVSEYREKYGSRFSVVTETGSVYSIDLDEGLVTRAPNQVESPISGFSLRRDGDATRLLDIRFLHIGEPMVMLLHGVSEDEGTATLRTTSRVTEIISL